MSYYKKFLEQKSKQKEYTEINKQLIFDLIDNKFISEIYLNKRGGIYKIDKFPKEFFNALKLNKTVQRLILCNVLCEDLDFIISMFKFNHHITTLKLSICNLSNIETITTLLKNQTSIIYLYLVFDMYHISDEIYDKNSEFYENETLLAEMLVNKFNLLLDTLKTNNNIKLLYLYNLNIRHFKDKVNEINKINSRLDIKFLN